MSRHPTDYLSLVSGLVFVATGLLLVTGGDATVSLAWFGPLAAVALGGLLILAARSSRPSG